MDRCLLIHAAWYDAHVMTTQQETIKLDPETTAAFARYAGRLGLSITDYLTRHYGHAGGAAPLDDADAWLDELSEGLTDIQPLPVDVSSKAVHAD